MEGVGSTAARVACFRRCRCTGGGTGRDTLITYVGYWIMKEYDARQRTESFMKMPRAAAFMVAGLLGLACSSLTGPPGGGGMAGGGQTGSTSSSSGGCGQGRSSRSNSDAMRQSVAVQSRRYADTGVGHKLRGPQFLL